MKSKEFNEAATIKKLQHFLPNQAPLKDFIHHNTLHAFQKESFHSACAKASGIFGYRTYLSLTEYRNRFKSGEISLTVLDKVLAENKGTTACEEWKNKLLCEEYDETGAEKIGRLRNEWKNKLKINISKEVHPFLFRMIGNYLDQGISQTSFPAGEETGFLNAVRIVDRESFQGVFKNERAKQLLHDRSVTLEHLLEIVVGDSTLFERYLFDQQFEHPGWSGMVGTIELHPESLLKGRKVSLKTFIFFELLLEIDFLDTKFSENWKPLAMQIDMRPEELFHPGEYSEYTEVLALWQDIYEWSYYNRVIYRLQEQRSVPAFRSNEHSFQAVFCLDDRECSIRRHIEDLTPDCQTFSTAGYFNVPFYFQPLGGLFHDKRCPAPLTPKHLIREVSSDHTHGRDIHFGHETHGIVRGWLSQTIGFWSAIKLVMNVFRPSLNTAGTLSFHHMNSNGSLEIVCSDPPEIIENMQVGFSVAEMVSCVEGLLRGMGLVDDFSPLIYFVGHGASSINNTYYAGYDCGACSGRPGSVNARVAAAMANHPEVRKKLIENGLNIPETTQFVGALHDTTRDELIFYDVQNLLQKNLLNHVNNVILLNKALDLNAQERAVKFDLMKTGGNVSDTHEKVKLRSVSLYEPRPEYNHATNAICIVGRRDLTKNIFLDRRSFLTSYNYSLDPDGKQLSSVLTAIIPVCSGINLEYYFSRMDNEQLGAGSKLPHNVIGLFGVANGADGDLRTGLPYQMIEIHDPYRLLVVVEQFPDVMLSVLQQNADLHQWFSLNWSHLIVIHPEHKKTYRFVQNTFSEYIAEMSQIQKTV